MLICQRCGWQGNIITINGLPIKTYQQLEQQFKIKKGKQILKFNGTCPDCKSIKILNTVDNTTFKVVSLLHPLL